MMGIMDEVGSALADGAAGGRGFDPGTIGTRIGLDEALVRQGLGAPVNAAGEHGDTLAAAQARTGLPLDRSQVPLAAIGGALGSGGGLAAAAGSPLRGTGGPDGTGRALGGLFGRG